MIFNINNLYSKLIDNSSPSNIRKLTIAIIILTVITAELRMHPFDSSFRFGLGVITFAFAALYIRQISLSTLTFGVAIAILTFRTLGDFYFSGDVLEALLTNIPGAVYYLTFGILIKLTNVNKYYSNPLVQGIILGVIDFGSNVIELTLRWLLIYEPIFSTSLSLKLIELFIVGFLRMIIVTGVYSSIRQYHLEAINNVERQKRREILLLTSNLQSEVFFVQKSSKDIERLIYDGYSLYEQLLENEKPELANMALNISTNSHEIKKDYDRIISGLRSLLKPPSLKGNTFTELVKLMTEANIDYAQKMGKEIDFITDLRVDFYPTNPMMIVSIINNLASNAVEAINYKGQIKIIALCNNESNLQISISDDGPGLTEEKQRLIFRTGYSRKGNCIEKRSTGLGLTHVDNLVSYLHGSININSAIEKGTTMLITFPVETVVKEWYFGETNRSEKYPL
ncbi:sensor histidine kinase [Natranaerobius trueperi]|uniref:histidine kinase n=1 Tax=Natranaerobius trueperi TaxID=759412 RepID=A0A226BXH0_9FIRM|nr:sensor histidine kinase [Natranaerobius trueperi]OWZ83728.1 hypothetical protein CDO51_07185 [Natranaerobius trueperi]